MRKPGTEGLLKNPVSGDSHAAEAARGLWSA